MLINSRYKIYEFRLSNLCDEQRKVSILQTLIDVHNYKLMNEERYKITDFNYPVQTDNDFFDNLYQVFLDKTYSIFGNFTLSKRNSRTCWAYINRFSSLEKERVNAWHNHVRTSTINSVYYFSIPDTNSGKIYFANDNLDEDSIESYQPIENSLILFPGTLNHNPEPCNSEKYRVSINMEIICEEDVWNKI